MLLPKNFAPQALKKKQVKNAVFGLLLKILTEKCIFLAHATLQIYITRSNCAFCAFYADSTTGQNQICGAIHIIATFFLMFFDVMDSTNKYLKHCSAQNRSKNRRVCGIRNRICGIQNSLWSPQTNDKTCV